MTAGTGCGRCRGNRARQLVAPQGFRPKGAAKAAAPHDTRRTCGSLLAALDVHPRVAMAILRHSKIALTMEIYTQVPDKVTRDALRRLSDQLDQAAGDMPDEAAG